MFYGGHNCRKYKREKRSMKKRLLGILFSLALMLTMMSVLGLSQTAYGDADITELKVDTVYRSGSSFAFGNDYVYLGGTGLDLFRTKGSGTITYTNYYGDSAKYIALGISNLEYYNSSQQWESANQIVLNKDTSIPVSGYIEFKVISGNGTEFDPFVIDSYIHSYPLWVGGTQVTSANMSGTGWSYTPATTGDNATPAKLTLNNFSCSESGDKNAAIYAEEDLVIETSGANTVANTSTEIGTRAIGVTGDLTLQGSGTLNATGGNKTIEANAVTIESGTVNTSNGNYGIYASSGDVIIKNGTVIATNTPYNPAIYAKQNITIKGGNVKATGRIGIQASAEKLMIEGGIISATGTSFGIAGSSVAINNGTIEATSTDSSGIFSTGEITINGGQVTAASGSTRGISGTVKNSIAGTGWTNTAGTEGKTAIEVSTTGQQLTNYKKVQFPADVEEVTVKFDSAGGSAVAEQTITVGDKVKKPADPTRSGYTFDGWYLGSTAFDFSKPVEADITLTAHWKKNGTPANMSTITYDLNGGTWDGMTGIVTLEVENGKVITLPAPTRDGYTFDYWEGSKYNAGDKYTVNGDHTFKAVWKTGAGGDGSKGGSSKKGVNTGDENTLGAWIVLLVAALAGTTGMVFARKRK